ncbi:hypothetical protein NHX12_018440 [Muraenolepis orangiensis]|uniref:BHLH domain-containing protein n=1 Tax=Muraenolepis orangiensis TaxID=630683 RepID=A0A9Q0EZ83_9TELE|nr:hypothetical protein NHX12_018440 [Muraenolepis orangiensis]
MSLVSGFPHHHPVVHHHHHDGHYSFHAAAGGGGGRCHDETGGPPYFTGWLISHADVSSPTDYGLSAAPGYSPEYTGGSSVGLDPHHHYGGSGTAMVPAGISVNGNSNSMHHHHHRPVKRRPTANRKERRRTQSINSAFAELRECIPNVPADTKLSKIKTLRLATGYIAYLMDILQDKDGQQHGDTEAFKADFRKKTEGKEERRRREAVSI